MTTDPHPDYAQFRCKTHDKAYCQECGTSLTVSSSPHDVGISTKQTAYDKIHHVDYSCSTHTDSVMIVACKKCVQEQLKEEYRRGKKDGGVGLDELKAAAGDILISFNAEKECRIPHHQVERLFKAVYGKDAKTPWEEPNP